MRRKEPRPKSYREVKIWAWSSAIIPILILINTLFIWASWSKPEFSTVIAIFGGSMLAAITAWWVWTIRVVKLIVGYWDQTRYQLDEVLDEVKDIKNIVRETFYYDIE